MTGAFRISAAMLASAVLSTAAEAAPAQLRGKSVIVSWTENRVQRNAGEGDFRSVTISHEFHLYVSTAGRIFSRLINTNARRQSGNQDRVGGGPNLVPSFQGQTMTIAMTGTTRGARLISVDFGSSFDGCSANVMRGKETGAATMTVKSQITGKVVEIKSVSVSSASCSMRPGNIFGGAG